MRIVIVCLLLSLVKSEKCNMTSDQLDDLKNSLLSSANFLHEADKNENAAICLGLAKSGKSTLINYLIGVALRATKRKMEPYKLVKNKKASKGPKIGDKAESETTVPTKWKSEKLPDLTLWDAPGFVDNRGIVQEIVNSFNIFHLVKTVKNLKVILVCDFGDIENHNPEQFLHLLVAVENLFGSKFADIFPSITMIFSKVSNRIDDTIVDQSLIKEILKESFKEGTNLQMSVNARNYLNYLVEHQDRIALFKKPNKKGLVSASDIDENIFPAINSSTTISKNLLRQVQLSMSHESKVCLRKTQSDLLLSPLYVHVKSVSQNIINAIDSKETKENADELKRIQNILQNAVNKESNIVQQFQIIKIINSEVSEMIKRFDIVKTIELVKFIDSLWKSDETINANLIGDLQLNSLLAHANAEMAARNLTARNTEIILEKIYLDEVKTKKEKEMQTLKTEVDTLSSKTETSNSKSHIILSISAVVGVLALCFFFTGK